MQNRNVRNEEDFATAKYSVENTEIRFLARFLDEEIITCEDGFKHSRTTQHNTCFKKRTSLQRLASMSFQ